MSDQSGASTGYAPPDDDHQVPCADEREAMRRNPGISLRYNFGDRAVKMAGRKQQEYADYEINLKPVPKSHAKDIRQIAREYASIMKDPEVRALQDAERNRNFCVGMAALIVFFVFVYFTQTVGAPSTPF